jgi:hypothetical protein
MVKVPQTVFVDEKLINAYKDLCSKIGVKLSDRFEKLMRQDIPLLKDVESKLGV